MTRRSALCAFGGFAAVPSEMAAEMPSRRPFFRDFVGLNGHTVAFKPDRYQAVCQLVRDYHPVDWDLGEETSILPAWPQAKNRVDWNAVYSSWKKVGLVPHACLMIETLPSGAWKNFDRDAEAYGRGIAASFGPSGRWPVLDAVEIGNEPGQYDDATYRRLFEAMARGLRAGDPKLTVATCNMEAGPSGRYWKGLETVKGLDPLYDVITTHSYAEAEPWPTWRRSFPEDPKVPFLTKVQAVIAWRDRNAPGKPVWVTEFGWDASTRQPDPKTEFAKWEGNSETQQAQWSVRAYLLFAALDVARAYLFFFDDRDEPHVHGSSGLTRNGVPKPAFHAVAWMLAALKNHRFSKPLTASLVTGYAYEFAPEKGGAPAIVAVWHPTRESGEIELQLGGRTVLKAERMPLSAGAAEAVRIDVAAGAPIRVPVGERPVFLWVSSII